jgi:hypothetical protein
MLKAKRLRFSAKGRFAETRELIAGYWHWKVKRGGRRTLRAGPQLDTTIHSLNEVSNSGFRRLRLPSP